MPLAKRVAKAAVSWLFVIPFLRLDVALIRYSFDKPVLADTLTDIPRAIGIAALLTFLILGPLLALYSRRAAGFAFLVLLAGAVVTTGSAGERPRVWDIIAALTPFVVPVVFWLFTSKWPPLVHAGWQRHFAAAFLAVATFGGGVYWWLDMFPFGDCGHGAPPLTGPRSANHIAFIGRAVITGPDRRFAGLSSWAVLRVDRRLWGPFWARGFVFVHGVFRKGDSQPYLIDGRRGWGALSHFLPIVENEDCGRSKPLSEAAVDLRTLQEGPPVGVRIIGRAPKGARRMFQGPSGEIILVADEQGIFERSDLPAGRYGTSDGSSWVGLKSGETWDLPEIHLSTR